MTLSTPSRWRRCDSINPAGPAPTIPTCVRISCSPLCPRRHAHWYSKVAGEKRQTRDWLAISAVLTQRCREIGDEIVGILDADREPHQGIADAQIRTHLRRHRSMGHQRGVLD